MNKSATYGEFALTVPVTYGDSSAFLKLDMERFNDQKHGFRQIFRDRNLLPKIMLAGFLLINPFLIAFAPKFFSGQAHTFQRYAFLTFLVINICTFWFPLGFTFEVLRRARTGKGSQLPDWKWSLLRTYFYEGAVKFFIALPTIIAPVLVWMALCYFVFIYLLGLPKSLMAMFLPPMMLFVIPFCGIACCRWLDNEPLVQCAFGFKTNLRIFVTGGYDYLIASAFIIGVNAITTSFYYTIPFGAVFGLCLVDTWFGPIYAQVSRNRAIPPTQVSNKPHKNDKRQHQPQQMKVRYRRG